MDSDILKLYAKVIISVLLVFLILAFVFGGGIMYFVVK